MPKDSFGFGTFQVYCRMSSTSANAWKCVEDYYFWNKDITWSDIREKVAKVLGVSLEECDLLAQREGDTEFLGGADIIKDGCKLVLRRMPKQEPSAVPSPQPAQTKTRKACDSSPEETTIDALLAGWAPVYGREKRQRQHEDEVRPSDHQRGRQREYICFYCGQKGKHYARSCPLRSDRHRLPVHRRTLPTGAGRSNFRAAANDQERKYAYRTDDGEFVVPKSKDSIWYVAQ